MQVEKRKPNSEERSGQRERQRVACYLTAGHKRGSVANPPQSLRSPPQQDSPRPSFNYHGNCISWPPETRYGAPPQMVRLEICGYWFQSEQRWLCLSFFGGPSCQNPERGSCVALAGAGCCLCVDSPPILLACPGIPYRWGSVSGGPLWV